MKQFLDKLKNKQDLTFDESKSAFEVLMTGNATNDEIYNFLTLLSDKGEVADEIAGGVYVLREKSKRVNVSDCIDTCGTGGDGMNTLNISTASALLLASMGTKVAKHGNKAVSSKCGSGDLDLPNLIETQTKSYSEFLIDPSSLNINADKFENLIGDDASFNANKMIEIFKGKDNDFSKAVCLNAAAGLMVNEKFIEFLDAYNFSREFILSGKPYSHLEKIQNV